MLSPERRGIFDRKFAAERARLHRPVVHAFGVQWCYFEVPAVSWLQPINKSPRFGTDRTEKEQAIFAHVEIVRSPRRQAAHQRTSLADTLRRNVHFEAARNQ